jgi:dGTPase
MTIRERIEETESRILSPYASLSKNSKGRKAFEEPCEIRTAYQRDRDRIIHCPSFRRLKHKTQVFLAPERDHYRTRLTHTLEVSQIARTIARALSLNEDLTEAVALGHDLGHTPFGHAGERALKSCYGAGFNHFEQSVRVVEVLEKHGRGLNLTAEVVNGILCHTKGEAAETLEGRIVRIADKIAYMNHDIDDALRAGILLESDIPDKIKSTLGGTKSERIKILVMSVIDGSGDDINMTAEIAESFLMLHEFLFESVYTNKKAKGEEAKAEALVISLFEYYSKNADKLPEEFKFIIDNEGAERAACDYIAGMTDRYAVYTYENLFVPRSWEV